EVYRARDTKLNRDVAVKVLPAAFANDAQRMARFQREAQALASLNHPNIASIHGLEESGEVRALVLPGLDGSGSEGYRYGKPVRQAVPLRWAGLSERSNPLRPLRSIASNLALEGVCCNRISTNTSFAASIRWKRFALTLGRTR